MSLLHFFILAVALPAILAVPTDSNSTEKQNCTAEERIAIKIQWNNIRNCFAQLINENVNATAHEGNATHKTCKSTSDFERFRAPFLNASKCATKNQSAVNEAFDVLIKMIDVTIANKKVLNNINTTKCIREAKSKLVDCVKENVHGQEKLAKRLGEKGLILDEMYSVNFQQGAAFVTAGNLNKCVQKVWKDKDGCSHLTELTDSLFSVVQQQLTTTTPVPTTTAATGVASNQVASSILMIATTLLAM